MYPIAGEPRLLPVRRPEGRLQFDMGATTAEEVDRIVVDWPAKSLRDITLIDTPGIASLSEDVSARSTTFLTPEDAPSEADAVVYLMRHLHASDLNFLEAFRDTAAGQSGTINALAVLSRADEVGAGRIDALLSARRWPSATGAIPTCAPWRWASSRSPACWRRAQGPCARASSRPWPSSPASSAPTAN
jgi:hypothetical protein